MENERSKTKVLYFYVSRCPIYFDSHVQYPRTDAVRKYSFAIHTNLVKLFRRTFL